MPQKPTMPSNRPMLVQCDFDGTVTIGDVSFQILDEFTGTAWRREFDDYMAGKITVNRFNANAFARVKADRVTLDKFVREKVVVRPGLQDLLAVCRERGFRFVIVSNGMDFYIETILKMLGLTNIEFVAGQARFTPQGIKAWYPGPDGHPVEDGFKESWTRKYLADGYQVAYIGNGASDFAPARLCLRIFGVDNLLEKCRQEGVACTPFNDLGEVARALKQV
jgi:2-hydroxy-3-keto-5-methylthiopentenyl-1-phosphate phosphatase